MFGGLLAANAVHRQFLMSVFADTLVIGTAQHLDNVSQPETLADAIHTGQRLARIFQPIVTLGRIQADIAVAAVLVFTFAKIVEQHQPAAGLRFGKSPHGV
ncbi:hypothetical protein D3C73_1424680 [compost metagenome]